MSKNIRTQLVNIVGKSLDAYNKKTKTAINELKFKEQYQGRIIDCMVGEVDDNYIETPETDAPIVKLEHSKEGVIKIPSIKGKTILVDADGNETDAPAEGCRLVSVGEQEDNKLIILSRNKNLFDRSNITTNIIGNTTLIWNNYNSCKITIQKQAWEGFYIKKLDKNKTYYLSYKCISTETEGERGMTRCAWYDSNGVLKQWRVNNNTNQRVGGLIKDATEVHFSAISINGVLNTVNITDIQLEEVSKTDYIEPKQHKTEILLDEPLRSLPNGVKDEVVGNQIIRRVGNVVVKGVENWKHQAIQSDGRQRVALTVNDMKIGCVGISDKVIWKTKVTNDIAELNKEPFIGSHTNTRALNLCIPNKNNIDSVKQWLSENPLEVLYELEEPIIEELPNGITLQGFDDATMYIENSITPTVSYGYNALIPYKEELSNQKEEVEVNTLDIENNIIPYLMDMEFNLMTMEDK